MKNNKIIESFKLSSPKEIVEEASPYLTSLDMQILKKYGKENVVFCWEKENVLWEIDKNITNKIKEYNAKKVRDIMDNALEILHLTAQRHFSKDKVAVLIYDAINNYEKIINEHIIRIKELGVYVYPGGYEHYNDNVEFIFGIVRGDIEKKRIFGSVVEDEQYVAMIKHLAQNVLDLIKIKESMEGYLKEIMNEVMPNTTYLLGYKLSAKLLSECGSLEKLSSLPSSTIQVIGAEKALFMHLRGKGKPPKHGLIFLSEYVQKVPPKKRGKVARVLALKISKCVRHDYFSRDKEFIGDKVKREMEEFVDRILGEVNGRNGKK